MATAVRRKKRKDEIKVAVGPFRNREDYKTCEDIQREVWQNQDIDIVPISLLLTVDRTGGILLGAYNSLGDMVGFVLSIPGFHEGSPVQHTYMVAVRIAYRNFDVGFKLKCGQRKESLKRKTSIITAAIDPMQPVNAYFALGKLGERADTYEENYFGETTSQIERGLPTDRIMTVWNLEDADVTRRLETGPPRRDLRKDLKHPALVNHLKEQFPGLMISSPVKLNCSDTQILFEVPYNLQEIKNRDLGIALEWQGKMRQVFRHYFKKRYVLSDFWTAEQDGHLRAFYSLEKKKI
jgi:predicted GNAT superfamily acetyltransferase